MPSIFNSLTSFLGPVAFNRSDLQHGTKLLCHLDLQAAFWLVQLLYLLIDNSVGRYCDVSGRHESEPRGLFRQRAWLSNRGPHSDSPLPPTHIPSQPPRPNILSRTHSLRLKIYRRTRFSEKREQRAAEAGDREKESAKRGMATMADGRHVSLARPAKCRVV